MKILSLFGLFHIAVSREHPGLESAAEYMRGIRRGLVIEAQSRVNGPKDADDAMRRAEHALSIVRDLSYTEDMLAGVEICSEGQPVQPSTTSDKPLVDDGDGRKYDYDSYAAGLRDGAGLRNSGSWTSTTTKPRNAGRRPHPHLSVVQS